MKNLEIVTDCRQVQSLIRSHAEAFPRSSILISGRDYFSATFDNSWEEVSFAVVGSEVPIAACLAWTKDGKYLYFDRPAFIEFNSFFSDAPDAAKALPLIKKQLRGATATANHLRLALSGENELSRQLLRELLSFSNHHAVTLEGEVDLRRPLDEIKKGFRSGHRQSISKGADAYEEVDFFSTDTPLEVFEAFRELHKNAAGRVTRNGDSWEEMYKSLLNENALLTVGRLGGAIIACSFFWLAEEAASYGSAAYNRDYFNVLPVAHFPFFSSMEWLKAAGKKRLFLGQVFVSGGEPKEASVAAFKRGFTQSFELLHEIGVIRSG